MRPIRLRVLVTLAVVAIAVVGLPAAGAAATSTESNGTYYGSVELADGGTPATQSQVWISIRDGRITGYQFLIDNRCADGSFANVGIDPAHDRLSSTALSGAHFSEALVTLVRGSRLTGRLTGTMTGASISGSVSDRDYAYTDGSGPVCTGGYAFTLRLPAPIRSAVHPVRLTLHPVVAHSGGSTSYGIGVSDVSCASGIRGYAVEIRGVRPVSFACEESYGMHDIPVVMTLAPGHTYAVTVQAATADWTFMGAPLRVRVVLPPAGSRAWQTVSGL